MKNKERILLLILACINFTHIIDFMIMMPLGTYLMPLFKINPQQFSFIVSAYTFSAGICGFIAAFFVDKFDRKSVLLLGYIGFIAGTFACAFAPTYELLVAARIFAGSFGGLIGAQVLSIVGDVIPFERRGTAMGTLMAAFSVASVVGVPVGLFLAAEISWHAPFIAVGLIGLVVIPLVYFYIPSMTGHIQKLAHKPSPFAVITNIINDANQQRGLLLMIILQLGHFSIIPFIAPYMVSNVGFTEHQVTYIYLVGGALTFFTSPMVGKLADKYGKFIILSIFIVLSAGPVFLITHMPPIPYYYVLVVTAFFFIFSGGRMIPAQAMITAVVTPQQRGGFMSINSSVQQLASGAAAMLAGAIVTTNETGQLQNYNYVGIVGIVISLFSIIIARNLKTVGNTVEESPQPVAVNVPAE
jgi:MFS transporter, DHA1 family, inner membrane transport protein